MRRFGICLVLLVSGCGIVKVSTGGGGAKSGGSQEPSSDGGQTGGGGDEASRLKSAYDDFAAKGTCAGKIVPLCAHELRDAAGIAQRPHGPYDPVKMWNPREGSNPDPQWISGWDDLPATEGYNESESVFQVIAQALVWKANRKKCETDYQSTYDARKKASDALNAKIEEALKEPSAHDRIRALVSLRPSNDLRLVGARFRLEEQLFKQFEDPARRDVFAWLPIKSPDTPDIRPLLSFETESKNHCANSERQKYFPEETRAVDEELKKARSLQVPADKAGAVHSLTEAWEMKAPFLGISTAKIVSITRSGQGGEITFETTRDEQIVLGCREAKDRLVIQNNTVTHDKSCTYGQRVWASSVKLKFADLPKAELQKGDEIEVLSQITEAQEKTKKSGKNERIERKLAGNGVFVVRASHDGQTVWKLLP